jgi:hypothetical protein
LVITVTLLETLQWSKINCKNAPPARHLHAATVLSNKMYIFGGFNGNDTLSDFWCFDFGSRNCDWVNFCKESSEWTLLGYFVQLKGLCLLTFQEFLIFHGGRDMEAKSEMYCYNTGRNSSSFSHITVDRKWDIVDLIGETPKYFHTATVWANKIIVFGGVNEESLNELHEIKLKKYELNFVCTDMLSKMAADPFYVLLSCLSVREMAMLSVTCRALRQKWLPRINYW